MEHHDKMDIQVSSTEEVVEETLNSTTETDLGATPVTDLAEKTVDSTVEAKVASGTQEKPTKKKEADIAKRQKTFKILFYVAFFVLCGGVLIYTFYNDFFAPNADRVPFSWDAFVAMLADAWFYLPCALIALGFCYLLKGTKLSIMCKTLTKKWHFKTCMETGVIGHYYNCITPLAVGGQPFEILHLSKHGVHGGVASALPIATFFLNQIASVTLSIVAIILFQTNALGIYEPFMKAMPVGLTPLCIIGLVCCMFVPTLVLIFCFFPKLGSSIVRFGIKLGAKLRLVKNPELTHYKSLKNIVHNANCMKKIATSKFSILISFILSMAEHVALGSIAYFTLRFFGWDNPFAGGFLEWLQIVQLCLILYMSISFVPTPGNSGAADLSFFIIFSTGLATGLAFTAMMVWRALSFYSFILIGFIFATVKKRQDIKLKHSLIVQQAMAENENAKSAEETVE